MADTAEILNLSSADGNRSVDSRPPLQSVAPPASEDKARLDALFQELETEGTKDKKRLKEIEDELVSDFGFHRDDAADQVRYISNRTLKNNIKKFTTKLGGAY